MIDEGAPGANNLDAIAAAVASPMAPNFAINGFRNTLEPGGNLVSVATLQGTPQCVLVMSYTIAKAYAQKIAELINLYEKNSGNTVPTFEDEERIFNAAPNIDNPSP